MNEFKKSQNFDYDVQDLKEVIKRTPEELRLMTQAFLRRSPAFCKAMLVLNKTGPATVEEITRILSDLMSQNLSHQRVRYCLKQLTGQSLVSEGKYYELPAQLDEKTLKVATAKYEDKIKQYPLPFRNLEQNTTMSFFWLSDKGKEYVEFAYSKALGLKKEDKKEKSKGESK